MLIKHVLALILPQHMPGISDKSHSERISTTAVMGYPPPPNKAYLLPTDVAARSLLG